MTQTRNKRSGATSISERTVQIYMHLQALQKGHTVLYEKPLKSGRLDLLCISPGGSASLIEVKALSSCKHAIGQLQAYARDLQPTYSKLALCVLLYNALPRHFNKTLPDTLVHTCRELNIKVVYAQDIWTYPELYALQVYLSKKEITPCLNNNPQLLQIASLYNSL